MLDKDFFLTIEDEKIRELVLTNARFTACFFDCIYGNEEKNSYNLEILDKMLNDLTMKQHNHSWLVLEDGLHQVLAILAGRIDLPTVTFSEIIHKICYAILPPIRIDS